MKPTHTNSKTGQPLAALKITVFVSFQMFVVSVADLLEFGEVEKPTRKQVEKNVKELAESRGASWFDWYEYNGDDEREARALEIARELFPDFITP